jgi:hypothetical protein
MLRPHPGVDREVPELANILLSLPGFGSLVYVFAFAVWSNLLKLGRGHVVEVAGSVYVNGPLWSYIYWLFEWAGPAFLIGIVACIYYTAFGTNSHRLIGGTMLVSILFLSLLSSKRPNYVIMLLPLLSYLTGCIIYDGYSFLHSTTESKHIDKEIVGYLLIFILILNLIIVPPFHDNSPYPKTEGGYNYVTSYIENQDSEKSVQVMSLNRRYIEYRMSKTNKNVEIHPPSFILSSYYGNETQYIMSCEQVAAMDYIVLESGNPIYESNEFYRYITSTLNASGSKRIQYPFRSSDRMVIYNVNKSTYEPSDCKNHIRNGT